MKLSGLRIRRHHGVKLRGCRLLLFLLSMSHALLLLRLHVLLLLILLVLSPRELRPQRFFITTPNFPDLCFEIGPPENSGGGGVIITNLTLTTRNSGIL